VVTQRTPADAAVGCGCILILVLVAWAGVWLLVTLVRAL